MFNKKKLKDLSILPHSIQSQTVKLKSLTVIADRLIADKGDKKIKQVRHLYVRDLFVRLRTMNLAQIEIAIKLEVELIADFEKRTPYVNTNFYHN